MKEEHVTFSGQESKPLTLEIMSEAIEKLRRFPTNEVHSVLHNCDKEKFMKVFNAEEVLPQPDALMSSLLYGLPVHRKKWVPLDEVWMVDAKGKVINKFKI